MKAEDYYLGKLVKDLDLDYPSTETNISTNDEKFSSSQFFKRDFFPKNIEFLSDSDPQSESKDVENFYIKEMKKKENKKKNKKEKLQKNQHEIKYKKYTPLQIPINDINDDLKNDDLKSQDLVLSDLRRINEGYKSKSKILFWGENLKSLNDDISSSEESKLSHIDIHSINDDFSKNDDLLS